MAALPPKQTPHPAHKILIVDNNPVIIELLSHFFAEQGHEVRAAEDGLAALHMLDHYVPDIMFVDLIMPNISGDKLCRIVRATPALAHVYLIVLSAIVADEEIRLEEIGAHACIAKGPLVRMQEHINEVLHEIEARKTAALRDRIIGIEDLTEREITKELLEANRSFTVILENMAEGVLQLTREREIIFVNTAAAALFAAPEEKLLSTDFFAYFSGDSRVRVAAIFAGWQGQPQEFGEEESIWVGGRQVTMQLLPVRDGQGETMLVILHDVTERKANEAELVRYREHLEEEVRRRTVDLEEAHAQLEERVAERTAEIEKLYKQLLHAEKMSAVGKLAASIAHEFNNPICGIRNVLEGLSRRGRLDDENCRLVELAIRECDRVAKLTSDLQSFNRPTSGKVSEVDLHAALEDILLLCKKEFRNRNITLLRRYAEGVPPIHAVADQIKQVFLNILTNAREAVGEEGGTVTVATEVKGDQVLVHVADTGSGIAVKDMEHIFEPFFSTKPEVKGTGLGLAVSYGIIERHGGTIKAQSEPGQGTRFTVALPLERNVL